MKLFRGSLLAVLACALLAPVSRADDETQGETVKLKYKSVQKWNVVLPQETFTRAEGIIKIPHAGGEGFITEKDGQSLAIDSNGDGKVDDKAKGVGGFVTLKGKNADGKKFKYAVRLVNQGGWQYSTSGMMVGKVGGQDVKLIDQNNNGVYNEYGVDAMIVGKSKAASFLSKVINVKGSLYDITVNKDGSELTFKAHEGEAGTLNLAKGFESSGAKLQAAVVKSESGDISFNLAGAKKGLLVPTGSYELASGLVSKGRESAKVRGGERSMNVAKDAMVSLAWGGPLRAEFEYVKKGNELTFSPNQVWYYGKAGEEYYDWVPVQTPKFQIRDAKTKRELFDARFGAS